MSELKSLPLGVYEKSICNFLSWEEKLSVVKESGFDCLEMSIDATEDRVCRLFDGGKTAADVNAAIEITGVPVKTMALTANRNYPLGSEDDAIRGKGIDLVKRAMDLAEQTNIGLIHLAAYDDHGEKCNDRTKDLFYESVAYLSKFACGRGVKLAFETMDVPFMGSCTNILSMLKTVGADNIGIYADTGNLSALGLDAPAEIRIGGSRIIGAHLKDATPGVMRDVVFGEGIVDFSSCLAAFKDIDFAGTFVAEMWSYDKIEFHSYLKEASSFLREKLSSY